MVSSSDVFWYAELHRSEGRMTTVLQGSSEYYWYSYIIHRTNKT